MANFTAVALQTVLTNQNVLLTEAASYSCCARRNIIFREGSGLVTLRGNQGNCAPNAVYRVTFGANIAVPTGGTPGEISLAISLNGEALQSTIASATPTVTDAFFHVGNTTEILIPPGCCSTVAIKNVSTQGVSVQNANITIERIA